MTMARRLARGFVKWGTNMTTPLHVGSIGGVARGEEAAAVQHTTYYGVYVRARGN